MSILTKQDNAVIKGNPITIAMVSTDHIGAGNSDHKLAVVPIKVKTNKGSCVIEN